MFELEWWVVAAFAVLVASILAGGYLADLFKNREHWSATDVNIVHVSMAVYATVVSAAIGLRFGWARLELSRRIAKFYGEPVSRGHKAEEH